MRTILISTCAAIASLSFAAAANAADSDPGPKPGATSHDNGGRKQDDPKRVICKSQQMTGSSIPKPKVCHTKQEWDDISEQSRQLMDRGDHGRNPQG